MFKKTIITIAVFLIVGIAVFFVGDIVAPDAVSLPQPITQESPCPAVGCASGTCHSFEDIPEPDGVHEMTCPEVAGCASVDCHAWDTLVDRYYQPSDASLNLWILAPVVLVAGLILLVKKI